METQYLKTLHVVLELGSFSKAATELCITQSAVSQRIRFLEDRYGVPLLERTGQKALATEAGRIVHKKAEMILQLEKELERELAGIGSKTRLSLSCTPTFGIVYLPMALNQLFLANSSDVDFKFVLNTPENALKGLLANEFDIAVIEHCDAMESRDAVKVPLPPDELLFISSPALQLPAPFITLEEILQQRLIARREGCSSRGLLQQNLRKSGKTIDDFKGVIIYDDLHLTIKSVQSGMGIAFVSRSLVADLLQKGELTGHTVAGFNCLRSRTAVLNRNRSAEPLVQDFVNSVINAFHNS